MEQSGGIPHLFAALPPQLHSPTAPQPHSPTAPHPPAPQLHISSPPPTRNSESLPRSLPPLPTPADGGSPLCVPKSAILGTQRGDPPQSREAKGVASVRTVHTAQTVQTVQTEHAGHADGACRSCRQREWLRVRDECNSPDSVTDASTQDSAHKKGIVVTHDPSAFRSPSRPCARPIVAPCARLETRPPLSSRPANHDHHSRAPGLPLRHPTS